MASMFPSRFGVLHGLLSRPQTMSDYPQSFASDGPFRLPAPDMRPLPDPNVAPPGFGPKYDSSPRVFEEEIPQFEVSPPPLTREPDLGSLPPFGSDIPPRGHMTMDPRGRSGFGVMGWRDGAPPPARMPETPRGQGAHEQAFGNFHKQRGEGMFATPSVPRPKTPAPQKRRAQPPDMGGQMTLD